MKANIELIKENLLTSFLDFELLFFLIVSESLRIITKDAAGTATRAAVSMCVALCGQGQMYHT